MYVRLNTFNRYLQRSIYGLIGLPEDKASNPSRIRGQGRLPKEDLGLTLGLCVQKTTGTGGTGYTTYRLAKMLISNTGLPII